MKGYNTWADEHLADEFVKQHTLFREADEARDYPNASDMDETLGNLCAEIVERWLYEQGYKFDEAAATWGE